MEGGIPVTRHWKGFLVLLAAAWLWLFGALGETRLMVVTDLHYLAPALYEGSGIFLQALRAGDGKIPQYGEELLAALAAEAERQRPDALVVTGDLSFNGEKASHEKLAAFFAGIRDRGIPVFVIPGNHDMNRPSPMAFTPTGWRATEGVDREAFAQIYGDFMLPPEGKAGAGLSYTARITDSLWLAMADVSTFQAAGQNVGVFTADHAQWLENALEEARQAGARVIACTHHNLLRHTDFQTESFQMFGHEAMEAILRQYGVRLNLSGHMHSQHIAREDEITDAATGAFCMTPHRYALVTVSEDGTILYEARELCGAHLPEGFQEMSRAWAADVSKEKLRASLEQEQLSPEETETMLDYAVRFHLAYFAGTCGGARNAWTEEAGYRLWRAHPESFFAMYLDVIMKEGQGEHLRCEIQP